MTDCYHSSKLPNTIETSEVLLPEDIKAIRVESAALQKSLGLIDKNPYSEREASQEAVQQRLDQLRQELPTTIQI